LGFCLFQASAWFAAWFWKLNLRISWNWMKFDEIWRIWEGLGLQKFHFFLGKCKLEANFWGLGFHQFQFQFTNFNLQFNKFQIQIHWLNDYFTKTLSYTCIHTYIYIYIDTYENFQKKIINI
jgi:hypothetical protein